jgi:hypothetical protein
MISSTLLAIPFVPVFYVMMQRLSERRGKGKTPAEPKGDGETGDREKKEGETQ